MLVTDLETLDRLLAPILAGDVGLAAWDTETTEVRDDRFTPWGTDTRIAGFSISYDGPEGLVDFYVAVRQAPYDWRRRADLIGKDSSGDGPAWLARLEAEGVTPEGTWAPGMDPNLPLAEVMARLQAAFASPCRWVLHNASFDFKMAQADGVEPPFERFEDTQFLSAYTDERPLDAWDDNLQVETEDGVSKGGFLHRGHALKHLAELYLGVPPDEQKLLKEAMKVLKCESFAHLPLRSIVAPYAWGDTRRTLDLFHLMVKRAPFQDERVRARYDRERELLKRVLEMERRGFRVKTADAVALTTEAERKRAEIVLETNRAAGTMLPLDNGPALTSLLYGELELPVYRDQRNTRKPNLKRVRERCELMATNGTEREQKIGKRGVAVVDGVLAYRKLSKEISAFLKPLTYYGADERVYTVLRQMAAATGRFASEKPNLQQMPKKGDVRKLFIPRDGHVFLFCDFSQIEMRVAAHYTKAVPEAFEHTFTWPCTLARRGDCKGWDRPHGPKNDVEACRQVIHAGKLRWSTRPDRLGLFDGFMQDAAFDPHERMVEVCQANGLSEIDRDRGKLANFTMLYGAGVAKVAEALDCSEEMSSQLRKLFWEVSYPELGRVKDFIGERLRRHGPTTKWCGQDYITTLHGRRFYLQSAHKALNYLIQGSAREIMGDAMVAVADFCERETKGAYQPLLTVHDELIFEVPRDSIDAGPVAEICRLMEAAGAKSSVPMVVEPEWSEVSWGDKVDFDLGRKAA